MPTPRHRHQPVRQHGDIMVDQPVYPQPPAYYYAPPPIAPQSQYRRPSLLGAFFGGMAGLILGIFRVLGHLFMLGVAILLVVTALGVGALVGIHKLTVWADDHPATTTTTAP